MVLYELAEKLKNAMKNLSRSSTINVEVVNTVLKEISNALLQNDVSFEITLDLRKRIETKIEKEKLLSSTLAIDKRKIINQIIFNELREMLTSPQIPFKPQRNKANVFMFVGLQGAGKTTTVSKLAYYYKQRGWRAGVIAADTFRAGAYHQLFMNAQKSKIGFYGR